MDKYRIEFHVHSIHSNDSMLTKYFMLLMCKIRKINCLAITDHNDISFAIKNKNYFEKHNISVIVGEEISTKDGEIIGLYLTKIIEPNLSAVETVEKIKAQNGYVYIPHPYDKKREKTVLTDKALKKIYQKVDLIEIHNGRNLSLAYSKEQENIANKYKIRKVVGSDAHTFYELGRNFCIVETLKKEDLLNEISKSKFYCSKCIKMSHFNTKVVKIIKLIAKGDIRGIIRGINRKFKKYK